MLNIKEKEFLEKLDEGYQIRIIFNENAKLQEDDMPEEMLWMSYEKHKIYKCLYKGFCCDSSTHSRIATLLSYDELVEVDKNNGIKNIIVEMKK